MVITYSAEKVQGQGSVCSADKVKTNGRTEAIALLAVGNKNDTEIDVGDKCQ